MKKHEFHFFGLIELNLNFKRLGPKAQWHDRFQRAPKHHAQVAWNRHAYSKSQRIYGGVANVSDADFTHKVIASDNDPSGLGRWTWTSFRGKNQLVVRIITGYRPVVDYSDKPGSVYSQHERHLLKNKDDRDPRLAFYEDLDLDIQVWLAAGDLLILGLDANENVRDGTTLQYIQKWGLQDVHSTRHPTLPPCPTHAKNTNNIPVDGLWCSPALPITAAGMSGFGDIQIDNADHRLLWVDLPNEFLFGFNPPSLPTQIHNRLNLKNP
jgi:hypothetical protein